MKSYLWGCLVKKYSKNLSCSIFILVIVCFFAIFAHSANDAYVFVWKTYNIPSGSNEPTLVRGDFVMARRVLQFAEGAYEPSRGEILVFKLPSDPSIDFIMRVIGLPGETIQMVDGVVHIDGKPVERERVDDYVVTNDNGATRRAPRYRETLPGGLSYETLDLSPKSSVDNTREYIVPEGHFFVLGDNRDNSVDSRFMNRVGFVPYENIVAVPRNIYYSGLEKSFVWWPLNAEFQ